ncbi:MAG: hypothetical protein AAF296_11585 [Pseudomonadota bacterium]
MYFVMFGSERLATCGKVLKDVVLCVSRVSPSLNTEPLDTEITLRGLVD